MKITFLSTGNSPDYYSFDGEIITAYKDGQSESFDLSGFEEGDKFQGIGETNEDGEFQPVLGMPGSQVIRDAYRDSVSELHVTLCQAVGPGHWGESAEFDSADYDPDAIHVPFNENGAGKPWALVRLGKVNPITGEVL